jgi:septum formation protein
VSFEVRVPQIEELACGPPHEVAVENAYRKATAVCDQGVDAAVLGVDTVVTLGGRIYDKPADRDQARATLEALSGRRHGVVGGLCLIASDGRPRTAAATTAVTFRALDARLLEWYLDTGEWRERAGAYAIQGRGAALVKSIEGDYLNVVGLPVGLLLELEPELVG